MEATRVNLLIVLDVIIGYFLEGLANKSTSVNLFIHHKGEGRGERGEGRGKTVAVKIV